MHYQILNNKLRSLHIKIKRESQHFILEQNCKELFRFYFSSDRCTCLLIQIRKYVKAHYIMKTEKKYRNKPSSLNRKIQDFTRSIFFLLEHRSLKKLQKFDHALIKIQTQIYLFSYFPTFFILRIFFHKILFKTNVQKLFVLIDL